MLPMTVIYHVVVPDGSGIRVGIPGPGKELKPGKSMHKGTSAGEKPGKSMHKGTSAGEL